MDWAITIGLMLCVLVGGVLSAAQTPGFFKNEVPEPLKSQQTMQVGLAWMLASIVPFWREQAALGDIAALVGLVTFVRGAYGVYAFGKRQAQEQREQRRDKARPLSIVAATNEGGRVTGKAMTKQRRRAARNAAKAS